MAAGLKGGPAAADGVVVAVRSCWQASRFWRVAAFGGSTAAGAARRASIFVRGGAHSSWMLAWAKWAKMKTSGGIDAFVWSSA